MIIKNKHLTIDDRIEIEAGLRQRKSLTDISNVIDKAEGTVRYEIKTHREKRYPSSFNSYPNICTYFKDNSCNIKGLCKGKNCKKNCKLCRIYFCNKICPKFKEYSCEFLSVKPYCCNGCIKYQQCRNIKMVYSAKVANQEYQDTLKNARQGEHISVDEIDYINENVAPRIKNGQSFNNIKISDDNISVSTSSLYNYTDKGIFCFRNIDLPKKVMYKKRNKNKKDDDYNIKEVKTKIDELKKTRNHDKFEDFKSKNPSYNIAEMDTVIGNKNGGKVLLTLLFRDTNFMIAKLIDDKRAKTVNNCLNNLKTKITFSVFILLFRILLTDNGVEFTMIEEIETIEDKKQINLFFCDAGKSNQKGKIEKNHVEIRKVLPKGTNFDNLTQKDIDLMMSHINSYKRKKLNNLSPYEAMVKKYGKDFTNKLMENLNYKIIDPKDIILKPWLIKKKKH